MQNEIFTQVELPTGIKAVIFEGYGRHFFKALQLAKGDNSLMMKFLMMQLVQVDGKELTEADIDNMHIRDISYASEVMSTMLSNDYLNGL